LTLRTPPLTGTIGRVRLAGRDRSPSGPAPCDRTARRVQIDAAIEIGPVLMHVVGAREQAARDFTLGADRRHLAARVHELVGIVRQQAEVQPVAGELLLVEIAVAGANRDVARRLLRQRQRLRIERHRDARRVQTGREAGLSRRRGVGDQAFESAGQRAGQRVGANLRVVHPVAAADREARVAVGCQPKPMRGTKFVVASVSV
jgi:hypothetical protein